MMNQIRKLVVAVVGLALIVANNSLGVDLTGLEPALVDGILAALTALGVYVVPNETPA